MSNREIKTKIGSAISLEEELFMDVKGRDYIEGLPKTIKIGTNEIVVAIDPELRMMIGAIKEVLSETPPELASDIIDYGIIMTGGSSLLRGLPELVFRKTGVKARLADEALYCVANGTGSTLAHLDTYKKTLLSKK